MNNAAKRAAYPHGETDRYCKNCNQMGHHFKHCDQPITSFGVLCHAKFDDEYRYLMVKRRYSYAYVELMCGWTTYEKEKKTGRLISMLTPQERTNLLKLPHSVLWQRLRGRSSVVGTEASTLFGKLRPHLNELYELYPSKNPNTEWGMPKGRRNSHERDETCGIREFMEETGFDRDDFVIDKSIKPLQEDYIGDDHKSYRNIYFIAHSARMNCFVSPFLQQATEISQIAWLNIKEIKKLLKPHQHKRLEVIELLHNFLCK